MPIYFPKWVRQTYCYSETHSFIEHTRHGAVKRVVWNTIPYARFRKLGK